MTLLQAAGCLHVCSSFFLDHWFPRACSFHGIVGNSQSSKCKHFITHKASAWNRQIICAHSLLVKTHKMAKPNVIEGGAMRGGEEQRRQRVFAE